MKQSASRVPAEEWMFLGMEPARRSCLEGTSFEEVIDRVVREGVLLGSPRSEEADDRAAPVGTLRVIFSLAVSANLGDLIHNARDGLRGRYWLSPDDGSNATRTLLERQRELLLSSLPPTLTVGKFTLSANAAATALQFPSTKLWIGERQLESGGQLLRVARWIASENEPNNPRMWQWTPLATVLDVKSAWITPDGTEWVSDGKKDRSIQIHRWGYS